MELTQKKKQKMNEVMERNRKIYEYYDSRNQSPEKELQNDISSYHSSPQRGPSGLLRDHELWKDSEIQRVVEEGRKREKDRQIKNYAEKRDRQQRLQADIKMHNSKLAREKEIERRRRMEVERERRFILDKSSVRGSQGSIAGGSVMAVRQKGGAGCMGGGGRQGGRASHLSSFEYRNPLLCDYPAGDSSSQMSLPHQTLNPKDSISSF